MFRKQTGNYCSCVCNKLNLNKTINLINSIFTSNRRDHSFDIKVSTSIRVATNMMLNSNANQTQLTLYNNNIIMFNQYFIIYSVFYSSIKDFVMDFKNFEFCTNFIFDMGNLFQCSPLYLIVNSTYQMKKHHHLQRSS